MKHVCKFVVLAVLAVAVIPAQAQDRKEMQGYIAGGYVMPEGRASDFLSDGWNISGGMIFRPLPDRPFGIKVDLGYSTMDANNDAIDFASDNGFRADDGYMSMWNFTAEILWEFGNPDKVGGYIGAGGGGYRRYAALTATALVEGIYCDPWWGWCYPYTTIGDVVTNSDTLTKWGWSVAAGITFGVGNGQLYLEARYHWMMSDPTTEYIPILLGYRF